MSGLSLHERRQPMFGRAKVNRPTLLLLIAMRAYAIAAIVIAVVAFFHAVD